MPNGDDAMAKAYVWWYEAAWGPVGQQKLSPNQHTCRPMEPYVLCDVQVGLVHAAGLKLRVVVPEHRPAR